MYIRNTLPASNTKVRKKKKEWMTRLIYTEVLFGDKDKFNINLIISITWRCIEILYHGV
jgi:hypothetical protein